MFRRVWMTLTREAILDELRRVTLPEGKDIVTLGYVKALTIKGSSVSFVLEVPAELGARMEPVRAAAVSIVEQLPSVEKADVVLTSHTAEGGPRQGAPPDLKIGRHPVPDQGSGRISGVGKLIAVASGKGGVGKSTIAANLALALDRLGCRTGLLDADIHGPSIPMMLGNDSRPRSPDGKVIIPLVAHGIKFMSIGSLLPEEKAVIWRGPMLMGALQQMLQQVEWGRLDTLVVDLPPGTGDVQLTLCQKFEVDGALIVCTPQDVALADARRAIGMFRELGTPVLGMIENMSHFHCPGCGKRTYLFGRDGVRNEARKLQLPFLGEIPVDPDIARSGDKGVPVVKRNEDFARIFMLIAELIM